MTALTYFHQHIIPATMHLLPDRMDSPSARAQILAICLQESRFIHRAQIAGPARGFLQFETAGVVGVMKHASTYQIAADIIELMAYQPSTTVIHKALQDNDILACIFGRLLLWTDPHPLPTKGNYDYSWDYYIRCWRPGKPHRHTWNDFYDKAWSLVDSTNP